MKKKHVEIGALVLVFTVMIFVTYIESAYAESITEEFDGHKYVLNYEITNGDVIDFEKYEEKAISFVINGTSGEFKISLPKTMPSLNAIEDVIILLNGQVISADFMETSCDNQWMINYEGYSKINLGIAVFPEFIPLLNYIELPKSCWDGNPVQKEIHSITCSISHHKGLNSRGQAVCVSFDSFDELQQRGYIVTWPIYSN